MTDDYNSWKLLFERERAAKRICAELNNYIELRPVLISVLKNVQELTGCEAVAVRLHDHGDYPYFVYSGFPESFIKKETSLCKRDDQGKRVASPDGKGYVLECMCGNIIRGRFDASLPFFTANGSFWSNNTSGLLASTSPKERQADTRNYCNSCGYESVALVPIKARGETMGLIQLNDKRTGVFTKELIEWVEMIGEQVGLAVVNSLAYDKLKTAFAEAKVLRGLIPICARCKKIRNDAGYWQAVESYIKERSEADFTHGYCTECYEALLLELREAG